MAVALAALAAPAQAAGKRKVGVSISGMPAGPIRGAISDVLKHHGFEAVTADLSGDSEDAIATAAKQGKLSAIIVGEVREGGKRVKLRVYGATGDLIGEGSWSEKGGPKKLAAAVERTLWARVGGPLSKARPASGGGGQKAEPAAREEEEKAAPEESPTYSRSKESEEAPAPSDEGKSSKKKQQKKAEKDKEEEEPSASGPSSPAAGPALDIEVGGRFVSRSLTWTEPGLATNPGALNPYTLGLAPALGAFLAWYPAAHFRGGWASNLGVVASVEYIPGLTSQTGDGSKYPTQASDYWGGARGRLALGPVTGMLTLGGGQHAVIFHSQGTSNRANLTGTPDVKYTYARAGVDLRIALPAKLSVTLGAGYRYVISPGDTNYLLKTDMFLPNAKVAALDLQAAAGYRLLPLLEARAGFDLRRYMITPGTNTHMVTSGVDQYLALWVGLAVVLDGPTVAGASSSEGEASETRSSKPSKKKADKAEPEEEPSEE